MKFNILLQFVCILISVAIFLYQSSLNVSLYLSHPTINDLQLRPLDIFDPPLITVCSRTWPTDPEKLVALGLNVNANTSTELKTNIEHCKEIKPL